MQHNLKRVTLNVQLSCALISKKIAQLKCTTNEKRNLSELDKKKNSNGKFSCDIWYFSLGSLFLSIYRVETALKSHKENQSR